MQSRKTITSFIFADFLTERFLFKTTIYSVATEKVL